MTAIEVREILESEHVEDDAVSARGQRIFAVANAANAPIDAGSALGALALPSIGSAFSNTLPSLRLIRRRARHLAGIHQYEIVCEYEKDQTIWPPQFSASLEQQDVWRSLPTYSTFNPDPYTDIGGIKIDQNGHPVQRQLRRLQFNLSIAYEATVIDDLTLALQTWTSYIGGVNEAAFHGLAERTVMYLGPIGHELRPGRQLITHGFLFDKNRHFMQFPARDQNGNIIVDFDGATGALRAVTVYWRANWDQIVDFASLGV